MKKSDFAKLRSMLAAEPEVLFFNYHPHFMIILPGKAALAYPAEVYFDFIADDKIFPRNVPAGTGGGMKKSGRGKKIRRSYRIIAADVFSAELLAAIKSVTGAALPKNRIFTAAEKYKVDPVMVQRITEVRGWSPEAAAERLARGAEKIYQGAQKMGFAAA